MNSVKSNYIISIFFIIISISSYAQQVEFIPSTNENWLVSVEEAYQISSKTNKPILANFTGSDWCGWCKKLRAEVFNTPEFKEWAKENVVLLELDYPRMKQLPAKQQQQNRELQQFFKVTGFPTIWVFDLQKSKETNSFQLQPYGNTGYVRGGATNYTKVLDQIISKKMASN